MTSTKRTAQRTQGSSGHALTITSALDDDVPTDAASPPSEDPMLALQTGQNNFLTGSGNIITLFL